jgi:nucleoside-diphosphate-sugar epimerase
MNIFVTGASGFIGSHLVPKLIQRGDTVRCLVREPIRAKSLENLGAKLAVGDVTARESMRAPMQGADAVIHLAGVYEFGPKHIKHMEAVNVGGTRNTLELAAELGVPKIIHVSTSAVFGNTRGVVVDESYRAKKEDMASEYERTKWAAHYEVAVPLQLRGAPLIILQPGGVTGAGDNSPHMAYFDFYLNRIPAMFGAKSGFTWAHVDDIANGHILALERGKIGEAYILAGPSMTVRQSMQMWEKITGIPAPKIWIPGWGARATASLLGMLEGAGVHLPGVTAEGLTLLEDYTFFVSADKAKRELGWQLRPVEETFKEVLAYELNKRGKSLSLR